MCGPGPILWIVASPRWACEPGMRAWYAGPSPRPAGPASPGCGPDTLDCRVAAPANPPSLLTSAGPTLCFATNGPGLTSTPLRTLGYARMALSLRSRGRGRAPLAGRALVAGAGLSLDFRRLPRFPPSTRDGGRLVDDRRHSSPDRCRPPTGWLARCAVVAPAWGRSCCVGTFAPSLAVLADAAVVGLVLPSPFDLTLVSDAGPSRSRH